MNYNRNENGTNVRTNINNDVFLTFLHPDLLHVVPIAT